MVIILWVGQTPTEFCPPSTGLGQPCHCQGQKPVAALGCTLAAGASESGSAGDESDRLEHNARQATWGHSELSTVQVSITPFKLSLSAKPSESLLESPGETLPQHPLQAPAFRSSSLGHRAVASSAKNDHPAAAGRPLSDPTIFFSSLSL